MTMWTSEFFRFLFVGVLNTIFGYGLYLILLFIGFHFTMAALIGQILGVLFNYKTISLLVFRTHDNSIFFRFISVYILTYFVAIFCLDQLIQLDLSPSIAGACVVPFMAVLTYLLMRYIVYYKVTPLE